MSFFAFPVGSASTHCFHVSFEGLLAFVLACGESPAQNGTIVGSVPLMIQALVLLFVSLLVLSGLFPIPISVAALALTGIGFGIIDNGATDLYVVVEVPRVREVSRIDPRTKRIEHFRHDAANQAVGLVAGSFAEKDDRQRDLAFAQVAGDRLAQGALVGRVVEQIVDQLERDAEVLVEKAEAGADYAITQLFFRASDYFALVERVRSLAEDGLLSEHLQQLTARVDAWRRYRRKKRSTG